MYMYIHIYNYLRWKENQRYYPCLRYSFAKAMIDSDVVDFPRSLSFFFSSSKELLLAVEVFRRPGDSDRALSFERTAHTLQDSVRAGNYTISRMSCIARFLLFAALTKVLHTTIGYWKQQSIRSNWSKLHCRDGIMMLIVSVKEISMLSLLLNASLNA